MSYFLKGKNDYSVYVYKDGYKRLFTEYVHSIYKYVQWLKVKGIDWDYVLVFCRRDRQIICYYKNGYFIDNYPDELKHGRRKSNW